METERSCNPHVAQMIETIRMEYSFSGRLTGLRSPSPRILAAMAEVPREEFVPASMRAFAYDNRALPIEDGQTISQPFIVAIMTDLLQPEEKDVMLEIGTGSGYQAAILSRLVSKVYSIEIIADLAERAKERFRRLGYSNIEVLSGDGYSGWPEHAPYEGIIVTAAALHIPQPLVEQLKPGARLIVPVRRDFFGQELMLVEKDPDGQVATREVLGVAFVPLTGGHGAGEREK